jgi:hypothetical protein
MEQDPSLQARVEAIEQVLKTIAPSAEFDSILELRENLSTLVIGGSASLGTGNHAKHITVVIKAKSDSAAVRREHAIMTQTRIRNFCLPKTCPIFAKKKADHS